MAAALHTIRNPNPNPIICSNAVPINRLSCSALARHGSLAIGRRDLARSSPWSGKRCLGSGILSVDRRIPSLVRFVYEQSKHSDDGTENDKDSNVEVEKVKDERVDESEEAWKQTLEAFKVEALRLKGVSQEAYEIYSKKAMVILQETSEQLKVQSEQARHDLSIFAKEISEEGKEYLGSVVKNSPDEVKDIVETFASADELKHISAIRDFYVGIPYGSFLALGGFLSFMLTGSIPAIRFGIIFGVALLALSVLSLRSWKRGKPSALLLKGQAALVAILFIREWRLFSELRSFPTFTITLTSGAILGFYIYRIWMDDDSKRTSLEPGSEE